MGTPLPYYEPGDPCPNCFGDGGPLGPEPTPKFIFAHFVDWIEGPAWWEGYRAILETEQRLVQHPVDVCRWVLYIGWSYWNLNWKLSPFSMTITQPGWPLIAFWSTSLANCQLTFYDTMIPGPIQITTGGQVNLRFQPEA